MNLSWLYALSVLLVAVTLPIFSYVTLIYRELGRMTTGRVHEHLEIFEAEIEPKLKINRRSGGRTFRILGHFLLAFLVLETTRGVVYFVPGTWESFVQFCVFLVLEVVIAMHFIPDMLLYRTTGRWLFPLLPRNRSRAFPSMKLKSPRSSARKKESKLWWKPRKKKASSNRNRRT